MIAPRKQMVHRITTLYTEQSPSCEEDFIAAPGKRV